MLNRILGRKKRTVWCEGYDSPVVLTPIRAMLCIIYIYSNPSKDHLEENIESYPGLSSWEMFTKGNFKQSWKRIRRPAFRKLPSEAHNLRGYTREAERVLTESKKSHDFKLSPNAWMEAFGVTDPEEQTNTNAKIVDRVRTLEKRSATKRATLGRRVIGKERLLNQPLDTTYQSKRSGKRMWCLSEDKKIRIAFIDYLKDLYYAARAVAKRWKLGDFSIPFPPGLYPPSMPKLGEPLQIW